MRVVQNQLNGLFDTLFQWFQTPGAGLRFDQYFADASNYYGLPWGLLARVAQEESGFDPNKMNRNSGASGIMQLIPRWHPGVNVWDPEDSIWEAARYLRQMYDRFGSWQQAVAGYNMGDNAVARVIAKYGDNWPRGLPRQTYAYVDNIVSDTGVT